jgi:hypothetical protein
MINKINYHVNTANPQNLWEKSGNRDNFIEKNKTNKVQYPINLLLENKIKNKNSKLENKK